MSERTDPLTTALHDAIGRADVADVRRLLQRTQEARALATLDTRDDRGLTPLLRAVMFLIPNEAQRAIIRALVEAGADVNAGVCLPSGQSSDEGTAIHLALTLADLLLVDLLLELGADIDATDRRGWTALRRVVEYHDPELVQRLLDAGGRVDAPDAQGETPLTASRRLLDETMSPDYPELVVRWHDELRVDFLGRLPRLASELPPESPLLQPRKPLTAEEIAARQASASAVVRLLEDAADAKGLGRPG